MGYSDQKYYSRELEVAASAYLATGTATASGTNSLTAAFALPAFTRKTIINKIQLIVKTAPKINTAALTFLNGTATIGTATISSTATYGTPVVITPLNTASLSTNTFTNTLPNGSTVVLTNTTTTNWCLFTAASGPTVTVVTSTSTASGDTLGAYEIYFENQEQTT